MAVHVAVAVSRPVSMRLRRQVDDLPMSHAPFGDDVIGELLHIITGSLQDRHLHAAFVV
jgi:hypothetical protein